MRFLNAYQPTPALKRPRLPAACLDATPALCFTQIIAMHDAPAKPTLPAVSHTVMQLPGHRIITPETPAGNGA